MARLAGCAAVAAACAAWSTSSAFVSAPPSAAPAAAAALRGAAAPAPAAAAGCSTLSGAAAVGSIAVVAAAAASAAAKRQRPTERRAITTVTKGKTWAAPTKQEKFARGLVGTNIGAFQKYEFDPLQFGERWPEHLPWYREAELKHGRLAMLAFLGFIVPDFVRIPTEETMNPDLNIVNAHNKLIFGLGFGPMWWLLTAVGVIESVRFKQLGLDYGTLTLENAGDLEFGKAFMPKTEEGIKNIKLKELNNGRLAMMAVGGIITAAPVYNAYHFPWLVNAL